ncbi:undecaprenyldiphospho-muramoylpentapeptide beta-N-acetylglucosaminyltransferase [Phascolarctobacterium sp.]|uniref:undecaprenyldiphospho-muramoylpentapeptide beta-N-acetylglucosaminyltransferase n=1 Tax=Phascolarctobacterium sp. TaxID=2049039 RepID=UPI0038663930
MKVILSGGGTGGHIYPALTIADQIKKLEPTAEFIFVGTQQGLEKDIIPRYGYPLKFIEVAGFKRSLSFDTLRSAFKLFTGLYDAYKIISEEKPDLVIGTGGYVCGPIVFMAALHKIPCCIQEQNAMPGVTNKILSRYVRKVFLGYKEAGKFFKGKAELVYTGNPIRTEILEHTREEAYKELGLDPAKKTILVSGGSRGARSINNAMLDAEIALSGRGEVQVLHATGDVNYDAYMQEVAKRGGVADNIIIKPYLHNMPVALAAADLAVFRAGAIGLAELMAKGVPSVLVPYPYATANHQEFNARAVAATGAAQVILDKELTGDKILEAVEHLLLHVNELEKMQAAAKALGRPQAAETIARQALALIKD